MALKVPAHMDTGDRCVQLNYDFKDHPLPQIIWAFFQAWTTSQDKQSCYPVITSVRHLSPEQVEIKRALIYHDFYNTQPYPEETLILDRSSASTLLQAFTDHGYKQDLTRLHPKGVLLTRQHLESEAHRAFQQLKSVQMLSNIYMYKSLRWCNQLNRELSQSQK